MSTTITPRRALLTVPELADWLHVSEKTAWRLLREDGPLADAKVKVLNGTRVNPSRVEAYIAQGGDV